MTQRYQNGAPKHGALILLAKEFAESSTVACLERLRGEGISVSLVGLSAGLVTGSHGLAIRPDLTLDQVSPLAKHKLLLLPGGKAAVSALFADPRVHRLIKDTLHHQGVVAAAPEAESFIEQAGLIGTGTAANYLWQGPDLERFMSQLIERFG